MAGEIVRAIIMMKPEWVQTIAAIAMAFATILLVLVTGWYARKTHEMVELEHQRDQAALRRRPKLDMTTSGGPPDVFFADVVTESGKGYRAARAKDESHTSDKQQKVPANCWWLRARVHNNKMASAEKVEVYITGISREVNGQWEPVPSFAPRRFRWANTESASQPRGEAALPNLHPEINRYCDIGRIAHPEAERWQLFPDPRDGETCQDKPVLELCVDWDGPPLDHALHPGKYELLLALSCANNPPVRKKMHIHFTGAWPKEQSELRQLVTVEILNDTPA